MERATFIVEATGERIPCLLNPENLTFTRTAGLRRPQAGSGALTGLGRSDEPLLHTGGGRTELELRLLFDVSLVTDPAPVTDVRVLTSRLWNLSENQPGGGGMPAGIGGPAVGAAAGSAASGAATAVGLASADPTAAGGGAGGTTIVSAVRMVWGRQLNYLAVIDAIAERLERFDTTGTPTRSWLFLRLVRVPDLRPAALDAPVGGVPLGDDLAAAAEAAAAEPTGVHTVLGDGDTPDADDPGAGGERLDMLAAQAYGGRAWLWRWLAAANGLADGPWAPTGTALVIPPPPEDVAS